jgi:hypothetical protein
LEYKICELALSFQEFLKIIPGIVIFPFSLYFAWKKIGINVAASFSVKSDRITASRISEVVLVNYKDKPITIFAIYAIIENDVYWEVDKFDPPIILKPLESCRIETKPYSELYLGIERYEPGFISDIMKQNKVDIYIATSYKIFKCKRISHPNLLKIPAFKNYRSTTKSTRRFNNIVYNDRAVYAITYVINSEIITAIVDRAGLINGNFNFGFNALPTDCLINEVALKNYLEKTPFGTMVNHFIVAKLKQV